MWKKYAAFVPTLCENMKLPLQVATVLASATASQKFDFFFCETVSWNLINDTKIINTAISRKE